jgi:Ran GTPase-activating protein (RanGAP) involved in mRNA processing and transport
MSDTYSDADSISDTSNTHVDAGDIEASVSSSVKELCNQLRTTNPHLDDNDPICIPYSFHYTEAECIAVFKALKENTGLKHLDFGMLFEGHNYTEISELAAAEYVESSKTLQTLFLDVGINRHSQEREMISLVLRALYRNTSVTTLIINARNVRFASVAFQELLTCTQTLRKLQIMGSEYDVDAFNEVQITAIISGFANNTTLRDLEFKGWREADLVPVLSALQRHPALKKILFSAKSWYDDLPSLSGLDDFLRSQNSTVQELVLEQVTPTVGLHSVLRELERNTTVTNLAIRDSVLSREIVQQVKVVLRQNTVLQSLDLTSRDSSALGSTGLAEIAPVLYRNRSIKTLDLSSNSLDDIESANVLRELLRRNKTITNICLAANTFGGNAAATRSIFEGLRGNTTLQQLHLGSCRLDDLGIAVLANVLAIRNSSMVELDLSWNEITSVGVCALVDDSMEVVTPTKLYLTGNRLRGEGVTFLANALGRNAMPNLKQLYLGWCHIDDDGFVALVSALEQNTSLQILSLLGNDFGERGFMALAESLPTIKVLQQIKILANASFQSTLPLLLEGFRKNTSLVEVNYDIDIDGCENMEWSQELTFLGQRNRFTPLLKTSGPQDASPQLGIWSRALAKVATEPDVLFHVLRNKSTLVGSMGGSKKRKANDE